MRYVYAINKSQLPLKINVSFYFFVYKIIINTFKKTSMLYNAVDKLIMKLVKHYFISNYCCTIYNLNEVFENANTSIGLSIY